MRAELVVYVPLVVRVSTNPVWAIPIEVPVLRVLPQASNEARDRLAPPVGHEPFGRLRLLGDELDETATTRFGRGFDDQIHHLVKVDGLRMEGLPVRGASVALVAPALHAAAPRNMGEDRPQLPLRHCALLCERYDAPAARTDDQVTKGWVHSKDRRLHVICDNQKRAYQPCAPHLRHRRPHERCQLLLRELPVPVAVHLLEAADDRALGMARVGDRAHEGGKVTGVDVPRTASVHQSDHVSGYILYGKLLRHLAATGREILAMPPQVRQELRDSAGREGTLCSWVDTLMAPPSAAAAAAWNAALVAA
mmetsp:Transcript_106686/g.299757  ORF Transcript_106686/g.299757 Transcript_106686/m.299757 type:complete len:308 (-) Transcript_106686:328-1251(-)